MNSLSTVPSSAPIEPVRLLALVQQDTSSDSDTEADALQSVWVLALQQAGWRVGGLVQHCTTWPRGGKRMQLLDVRSPQVFEISQDLGPQSKGCCLDPACPWRSARAFSWSKSSPGTPKSSSRKSPNLPAACAPIRCGAHCPPCKTAVCIAPRCCPVAGSGWPVAGGVVMYCKPNRPLALTGKALLAIDLIVYCG